MARNSSDWPKADRTFWSAQRHQTDIRQRQPSQTALAIQRAAV